MDICDGQIHHMVAVSDGVKGTLYVDDVAGTAVPVPAGTITMSWACFGAQYVGGPFHNFGGALIVGRIYPFALTSAEVHSNYAAGYL